MPALSPIFSNNRYGERLLTLEELSVEAIQHMMEEWRSFGGKPFDPQPSIHDAVGKIITALVNYCVYMC